MSKEKKVTARLPRSNSLSKKRLYAFKIVVLVVLERLKLRRLLDIREALLKDWKSVRRC